MAYWYVDIDSGSNSNSGDSWAQAYANLDDLFDSATLGGGSSFVDAGDVVYFMASNVGGADTKATTRTLDPNGGTEDVTQEITIIGVDYGTTNEGANVVASDVSELGTTQPIFQVTGAGNDLTLDKHQPLTFFGVKFDVIDQFLTNNGSNPLALVDCVVETGNRIRMSNVNYWYNTNFVGKAAGDFIQPQGSYFEWNGGAVSGGLNIVFNTNPFLSGVSYIRGVDFSGASSTAKIIDRGSGQTKGKALFYGCKYPSGAYTFSANLLDEPGAEFLSIASDGSGSHSTSIQDYEYVDMLGSVDSSTNYRDGGADDQSTGEFSYALAVHNNTTADGTALAIKSPWLSQWVDGDGATSKTATVYTTHDDGSGDARDLYENELKVEFIYVAEDGYTQHIQTFDANIESILASTTAAGADDTTSTWNNAAGTPTNNTYKRSFSVTYTPDYPGFIKARVWMMKRMTTSIDVVYVDGKIGIA